MDAVCFNAGIHCLSSPVADKPSSLYSPRRLTFRGPLWSVRNNNWNELAIKTEEKEAVNGDQEKGWNGNWVFKILHVTSLWKLAQEEEDHVNDCGEDDDCDVVCVADDHAEKIEFDRESFSKLLRKVSLEDARLYARMSYLGKLAYSIPKIKPGNLLRFHGLQFVTSSTEKKEQALKKVVEQQKLENPDEAVQSNEGESTTASTAYQIAASAASYLHSHTRSILQFRSFKSAQHSDSDHDVASFMANTDSMTAVVAAKEEVKQAVADDLNSTRSSPCEWFVCDDNQTATRFFVIQGSESLASWQANLLFEPIQFEGLDVLVHRGIYEAAKGIYNQMLPEIHAHRKAHGNRATFYFTGHSLGGSLSLLVNLMLLIRKEVPRSSLLPIVTFGSPSIMCGGDSLLHRLGLPRNHVQSITMHRDIVPRAFSCNYPTHVAEFLKAINQNFRSLPCLCQHKLLYTPMGELLILQPDEKISPSHDLLPLGCGLYILTCDKLNAEKHLQAAQYAFLNSPHPLEILRDRSAYGFGGTIVRDHDMNSYVRCIRCIIRQELSRLRKSKREHRKVDWWEVMAPAETNGSLLFNKRGIMTGQGLLNFHDFVKKGRKSLKKFSMLIASQNTHLLVVLLFPAKFLILRTCNLINYR